MAVGDMRYTFTDKQGKEHQVDIPAEILRKGRKDGLSNRDTIMLYLANNGYMVDAAPTMKQQQKNSSKKVTRTRTRKPDQQKQFIINILVDAIKQQDLPVNVINAERQFQFELEGEMFEVTLVKKRKPKS